jgi:hypothetical protein
MNLRERIAYELVKPRQSKIGQWLLWGIACVVIAWGFAVSAVTFRPAGTCTRTPQR